MTGKSKANETEKPRTILIIRTHKFAVFDFCLNCKIPLTDENRAAPNLDACFNCNVKKYALGLGDEFETQKLDLINFEFDKNRGRKPRRAEIKTAGHYTGG